jgi:hypothetical protein
VTVESTSRAVRLLTVTEKWFPFVIDPKAVTVEQMALAGLVRCRRLLHGMILVHESPDLGGVFARTLYETYLSALYLLLGGDAAYERLEANDDFERRRLAKRFLSSSISHGPSGMTVRTQSEELLEQPVPLGKRIDTATLCKEVQALLRSIDDPNADWPVSMYTVLFGPESYTTLHGGLGAMKQYMLAEGKMTSNIGAEAWSYPGNDHRLDLMTAAVLGLAYRFGVTLGLPVVDLVEIGRAWGMKL